MMYQTLKYIFVRTGLSLFFVFTLGFFSLYFIHEIAIPGITFDNSFIQWLIFAVCTFFGFFAYGMIGDQRFQNAIHKYKDIPSTANPLEIINGFQALLDFTYSSSFLPNQGRRLRNTVIPRFADYLLFTGQEDEQSQKIYLKAFLLNPKKSPYRNPLLSLLEKGGDLTNKEIDLLLVILKVQDFSDSAIVNHLASIFLRKCLLTRKIEPVYLSAIEHKSLDTKEIVNFILPQLLEKKRSDSFALHFYLQALMVEPPETPQIKKIVAYAYCQAFWEGVNPSLHKRCGEVFEKLELKWRNEIIREIAD